MFKHVIIVILIFNLSTSFSQNGIDFKVDKQLYLRGNSALIGNTILGVSAKNPLHSFKKYNDVLKVKYTDIDNDNRTFSSSAAALEIPENKKIKYAALYWSAIYKYEKGKKTIKGNRIVYSEKKESLPNVQNIYFKTPNANYQEINGTVIFNSKDSTLFKATQPYLCFADVTSTLQNADTKNGFYTIANVRATQGYINGGSAGGWLLYVIYENEEDTKKYFTTYNGFIGVDKESLTISFSNFKTPETGPIHSSILLGALEGDRQFKTDECAIIDAENKFFIPLSTEEREADNFFNSTITALDNTKRNPNSINTLGVDILKMPLPNENNQLLNNNSTKTELKLTTRRDGFYLFFVAFETEISETFKPENSLENKMKVSSAINKTIKKETAVIKNDSLSLTTKDIDTTTTKTHKNEVKAPNTEAKITTKTETKHKTETREKSYLLVTNVFEIKDNATRWKKTLIAKGYHAQIFLNPENNWYYVYILKDTNLAIIEQEHNKLIQAAAFKDLIIKAFHIK